MKFDKGDLVRIKYPKSSRFGTVVQTKFTIGGVSYYLVQLPKKRKWFEEDYLKKTTLLEKALSEN